MLSSERSRYWMTLVSISDILTESKVQLLGGSIHCSGQNSALATAGSTYVFSAAGRTEQSRFFPTDTSTSTVLAS